MPDVWAAVTDLDEIAQERLATVLETRGADPQQREMRRNFLSKVFFPAGAKVVEIGCGTGVLTRVLAQWMNVQSVVGVDPAISLVKKARKLSDCGPHQSRRRKLIRNKVRRPKLPWPPLFAFAGLWRQWCFLV